MPHTGTVKGTQVVWTGVAVAVFVLYTVLCYSSKALYSYVRSYIDNVKKIEISLASLRLACASWGTPSNSISHFNLEMSLGTF